MSPVSDFESRGLDLLALAPAPPALEGIRGAMSETRKRGAEATPAGRTHRRRPELVVDYYEEQQTGLVRERGESGSGLT